MLYQWKPIQKKNKESFEAEVQKQGDTMCQLQLPSWLLGPIQRVVKGTLCFVAIFHRCHVS